MSEGAPSTSRRSFFAKLNLLIGGAIGAVMAVPVLGYVLFPVKKRTVARGSSAPIPVADLAEIPSDFPIRVPVIAPQQSDAWASVKDVPLGSCWLRKRPDGSVLALSATCPHLGCAVDFNPAAGEFRCPCHTSAFDLDGKRKSGPAKRGMDSLDTTTNGDRLAVRFVSFQLDIADKKEG